MKLNDSSGSECTRYLLLQKTRGGRLLSVSKEGLGGQTPFLVGTRVLESEEVGDGPGHGSKLV